MAGTLPNSAGVLRFGGNGVWSEWFAGRLDEIRIYDRALTQAELQTDMTKPVTASGFAAAQRAALGRSARRARAQARARARRMAARKARRTPGTGTRWSGETRSSSPFSTPVPTRPSRNESTPRSKG